jgi:hypothetical protein
MINCETMKNITVSLDEDTYRRARMAAAQRDTSVSALVKRFLVELAWAKPSSNGCGGRSRNSASGSQISAARTGCRGTNSMIAGDDPLAAVF